MGVTTDQSRGEYHRAKFRPVLSNQTEMQKGKKNERKKINNRTDLWGNMKWSNTNAIRVLEKRREKVK